MDDKNKKIIDNEELGFERQAKDDLGFDFNKPDHTLGELEQN